MSLWRIFYNHLCTSHYECVCKNSAHGEVNIRSRLNWILVSFWAHSYRIESCRIVSHTVSGRV